MKPQSIKAGIAQCVKRRWAVRGQVLRKGYVFKDFNDAFAFMTRAALSIAEMNHHPDWHNSYNKIYVELTTHDTGGVSVKDIALAKIMDKIADQFLAKGIS